MHGATIKIIFYVFIKYIMQGFYYNIYMRFAFQHILKVNSKRRIIIAPSSYCLFIKQIL